MTTAQYPIAGGFPNYGSLLTTDEDGRPTQESWRQLYYLLKLLFDRTGGNTGQFLTQQLVSGAVSFMSSGDDDHEESFPMPSRMSPGGWFDEKGSGGTYGFAAGTDFTAGTSTTLTLSQPYGSQANLIVAFDGAWQGADQFSLNDKTLTFTSPIPVGTSKVFVKGFLMPL